jgi:hypothetical protein
MPDGLTAADRLEIAELFARWAVCEDAGLSESWADLFTETGSSVSGKGIRRTGREALADASRRRWQRPESKHLSHWMADPTIRVTDGAVYAEHYAMVLEDTSDGPQVMSTTVRSYELLRENGRWKVQERTIRSIPEES